MAASELKLEEPKLLIDVEAEMVLLRLGSEADGEIRRILHWSLAGAPSGGLENEGQQRK